MPSSDVQVQAAWMARLRSGLGISVLSMVWTTVSSIAGIALGAASGSLVVVAFGLTGLLDAAGSATLAVYFRHAVRHESLSARYERRASRVVSMALVIVGLVTGIESVRRLVVRVHPDAVPAEVVLASASTAVLVVLAVAKGRLGRAIPSRALVADGLLSGTGALLGLATVAGTALTAIYGWWWVDALAAAVVACGALAVGLATSTAGRRKRDERQPARQQPDWPKPVP